MQECPYCHEKKLNPLKKFALRKSMFNTCSACGEISTYLACSKFKMGLTYFFIHIILMSIEEYININSNKLVYWAFIIMAALIALSILYIPLPYVALDQAEKVKSKK